MNALQLRELEILKIFLGICNKHNLKYFLVCGSVIGAVKYNGFIPWDDDIDVGLLREDYEKFIRIAPKELPEWCFLQNYKTDKEFPHLFTKLRDSRTTFIEKNMGNLKINHGIYIDVFPIDGYPTETKAIKKFELKKKVLFWKTYCALKEEKNLKIKLRNLFFRILGYHKKTDKTFAKIDKLFMQYPTSKSQLLCNFGNWQEKLEYAPKFHYGEGIFANFEGLKVRIPENYDEYLTQKYGDWQKDLDDSLKVSHHIVMVCDTENPYTKYIKK